MFFGEGRFTQHPPIMSGVPRKPLIFSLIVSMVHTWWLRGRSLCRGLLCAWGPRGDWGLSRAGRLRGPSRGLCRGWYYGGALKDIRHVVGVSSSIYHVVLVPGNIPQHDSTNSRKAFDFL